MVYIRKVFCINLIFTVAILIFIEGIFFILNSLKERIAVYEGEYDRKAFFQEDELLGYKPKINMRVSSVKKIRDKTIYNITYSIDEFGRRITPIIDSKQRPNFIMFFGCSYTFGQGVNDNETMPFYVSKFSSSTYSPYNYGCIGYGPQNMLAKLQSNDINKEIKEKKGILIYTFIDDHIRRVVGSMRVYNTFGKNLPYFTIDKKGKLIRKCNFTSGRPVLSFLYRAIWRSQLVRYFCRNIDFKLWINESDLKLTCRILEEAYSIFRKKFNSEDFYVIFYPHSIFGIKMIPYLEKAGIKYLDYSLLYMPDKEFRIEGDGHPNKKAYLDLALRITKDLGIFECKLENKL